MVEEFFYPQITQMDTDGYSAAAPQPVGIWIGTQRAQSALRAAQRTRRAAWLIGWFR